MLLTVAEFVQLAKAYSSARDKKAINVWESYVSSLQKAEIQVQFHLYAELIAACTASQADAALLAAQSLRTLCRKAHLNDDMLNSLFELLRQLYSAVGGNLHHVVLTQVVLATAACFVVRTAVAMSTLPCPSHIDSVMHMSKQWLEYMQQQQVTAELQVQVLQAVPEHCEQKVLKAVATVKGPGQLLHLKSMQCALVFCVPSIVDVLKTPMTVYSKISTDAAQVQLYQQCLRCCAAWMKLQHSAAESADVSHDSFAPLASLLHCWIGPDDILPCAIASLQQLANLELIEEIEDDYNALLEALADFMHNATELLQLFCHRIQITSTLLKASIQLLQHFQMLLGGTEAFLQRQINIHSSRYDVDLSLCLEYCKSIVLLVADCTGHVHTGVSSPHNRSMIAATDGGLNAAFLTLSQAMYSLCDKLVSYTDHTMKSLHRNHIHRDCMVKFTREILTSAMGFWAAVAEESSTLVPSADRNPYQPLLQAALEQGVLISRFEDFSGGHADDVLAEIEAINDYRSILRDFIRDLSTHNDGVFLFLLHSAARQLQDFRDTGSARLLTTLSTTASFSAKGHHLSTKGTIPEWMICESYLHALSAICKESLHKLSEVSASLQQSLGIFLSLLASEVVMSTRILCRMAVLLLQEIVIVLVDRGLWLAGTSNEESSRAVVSCVSAVVFSLNHVEEGHVRSAKDDGSGKWLGVHPLFRVGQEIAFRVKQDHIGAVSLFKLVSELTQRVSDGRVLCSLFFDGSTCASLLQVVATQTATHPIHFGKGTVGQLSLYCFAYLFTVKDGIENSRNADHPLSSKSFGMSFSALSLMLTALFRYSADNTPGADLLFALLLPLLSSSLQSLQQRSPQKKSSSFHQNIQLLNFPTLSCDLSVVAVVNDALTHFCPLQMRLSLIGELLKSFPKLSRLTQCTADNFSQRMLTVSTLVLGLGNLLVVDDHSSPPLFSLMQGKEVQAFTELVACVADFYGSLSAQCPQLMTIGLSPQLDNFLGMYSKFVAIALLQQGNYFALGAAHSITRLIVAYRLIVGPPLDDCFLRFFQQISSIGVQAVRREMQEQNEEMDEVVRETLLQTNSMFNMERDSKKDIRRAEEFQHILCLSYLLEFWIEGLRMTDLGTMHVNKPNSKARSSEFVRIPWTSIGWPVLQTVVDILCECCLGQSDRGRTFTDTTWLQILELLQVCQGPLVQAVGAGQASVAFVDLMTASTTATESCQVIPEVGAQFVETGRAQMLTRALLHVLEHVLPSTIRDSGIRCLQHVFFTCGASIAAGYVLDALRDGNEAGSDVDKRAVLVASHLHGAALCGDWKRFKVALKVLFQ